MQSGDSSVDTVFPRSRRLWLVGIGLIVALSASWWVRSPGYMDADYYFVTGRQLAAGRGFSEPFLWNYLDDPLGIPHPSHLYWMPLTSVLAAGSMKLFGSSFRAAQLPFILMAAALPIMTAWLSLRITRNRDWAWMSGLLAAFPGFFLPFFVTTDAFVLYAILASSALYAMAQAQDRSQPARWLVAGALIGFCSLARADGLLLLLPALLALAQSTRSRGAGALGLALGFILVMIPWWLRNLNAFGSIFAPGAARSLWLLEYDELFIYPADLLTPARLLEAGIGTRLTAWSDALGVNLQRLLAENGMVFLGPFMLLGVLRLWRERPVVRLAVVYLGVLLLVMTLVFPFIGPRGALFHSGAGLMPILWCLAPPGLDGAIRWLGRKRGWSIPGALKVLGSGAVALTAILTIGLFLRRVGVQDLNSTAWGSGTLTEASLGDWPGESSSEFQLTAVNNPPGFFLISGRPAVVIPYGGPDSLRAVVERYGVRWVVLEANHPRGLSELYRDPGLVEWLKPVAEFQDDQGRAVWLLKIEKGSPFP